MKSSIKFNSNIDFKGEASKAGVDGFLLLIGSAFFVLALGIFRWLSL